MTRVWLILVCMALVACSSEEPQGPGQDVPELLFPGQDAGSNDAVVSDITGSDMQSAPGCECPPKMHCNAEELCEPDICTKGQTTCGTPTSLKICAENGASFEEVPCGADQVCQTGACQDPLCTPNEITGCDGAQLKVCNSVGTGFFAAPCQGGTVCKGGECLPIESNVVLLVDTSGSMNWMDSGKDPATCFGGNCPPWSFPSCDDAASPKTRLGRVKAALASVLGSESSANLRLALQRFPQVPFTEDWLLKPAPTCEGGYWEYTPGIVMSGDNGMHATTIGGWFTQNLGEILAFPFNTLGTTNLSELATWFDFSESVAQTQGSCFSSSQCPGGPCINGNCSIFTNPELRAVGATPIGKSLFYAGEYLRHFVLVEGKPCQDTIDCGSPHHTCVNGKCHDPYHECRPTVIIAFTDGDETENVHIDDFFHPRVQAKRFHFGLGCSTDSECLNGATCVDSRCVPPPGVVDEEALACESAGLPCNTTNDCPDPCANWGGCQGFCLPAGVKHLESGASGRLTNYLGEPVSVTVHIVDASGVPGANKLVAHYGGGNHFSVDLSDPDALISTFNNLLGDAKTGFSCGE